jgi:hypothetical protein
MTPQEDYAQFLADNGFTEEVAQRSMASLPPATPNPAVDDHFQIGLSPIHGVGVFAKRKILRGETFPTFEGSLRFSLARYVNHSSSPNVVYQFAPSSGWMTPLTDLEAGTEILVSYEDNRRKQS